MPRKLYPNEEKDFKAFMKWFVIFLLFCIGSVGFCIYENFNETSKENNSNNVGNKLFYTKYGTIMCSRASERSCGINLYKCVDDRNYYCLHDVAVKE